MTVTNIQHNNNGHYNLPGTTDLIQKLITKTEHQSQNMLVYIHIVNLGQTRTKQI